MNNQMNQYMMWDRETPEKNPMGCEFCHSYNVKQIDTEILENRTVIMYQCYDCLEVFEVVIKDDNLVSDTWLNNKVAIY